MVCPQQPAGGAPMAGGAGKPGGSGAPQHHHGAINLTKSEESVPPASTVSSALSGTRRQLNVATQHWVVTKALTQF